MASSSKRHASAHQTTGLTRRAWISGGISMMALSPLLTACGFQLRQEPKFAFRTIYIVAPPGLPLVAELQRAIQQSVGVVLLTEKSQMKEADVLLDILSNQQEKLVAGLNATGQVREFKLRASVTFRLRTQEDKDLVTNTEIVQLRDFSYTETAALAKESEEALLYRNMQTELVQQIMRRMAAVQPR